MSEIDVNTDGFGTLPAYSTIVVGTDGSALSGPTVTRAARLAKVAGAQLYIVCAWSSLSRRADAKNTGGLPDARVGLVAGRAAAERAVQQAVDVARGEGAQVGGALLVDGEPVAALLQVAAEHRASLLVVGAIRDTSITSRLLGDVASEVVRRAHCEVLVVRPPLPVTELEVPES